MPIYHTVTYTTSGTKASLNLDPSICPFNAAVTCNATGTVSYKMQYSLDPFDTVADADALWFDSGDIPAGTTTSAISGFTIPASRIRLVIATLTGGAIILQTVQSFSIN